MTAKTFSHELTPYVTITVFHFSNFLRLVIYSYLDLFCILFFIKDTV